MFWTCSSWTAIVLQLVIWEYCGEYDSKLHCFWVCLCIYTTKLQNTIVFVFTGQKVKKKTGSILFLNIRPFLTLTQPFLHLHLHLT